MGIYNGNERTFGGINMNGKKYTEEEIAYIITRRQKGWTFAKIARRMSTKFGTPRTQATVYQKYKRVVGDRTNRKPKQVVKEKKEYMAWPIEQVNFIHQCYHNGFSVDKSKQAFTEQFKKSISTRQYNYLLYNKTPSFGKKVRDASKPKKGTPYTQQEINLILKCKSSKEAEKYSETFGRTKMALNRYWYVLKEKQTKRQGWNTKKVVIDADLLAAGLSDRNGYSKAQRELLPLKVVWPPKKNDIQRLIGKKISKENADKFVELKNKHLKSVKIKVNGDKHNTVKHHLPDREVHATTYPPESIESQLTDSSVINMLQNMINDNKGFWTNEKDLDLLINFYDLTIDEATERYATTYGNIASRLETLINSNNPDKIALVMKASKAVKKNRAKQVKESKPSRRERRKQAKEARKLKREQKRIEKLKNKIKKLEGDE